VFSFLDKNADLVDEAIAATDFYHFNLCYEQLLFAQFAGYRYKTIAYLLPGSRNYYDPDNGVGFFHAAEENSGFVHTLFRFKGLTLTHSNLKRRLREKYPKHYDRINHLLNISEI
jgi:hypothetical protein